MHRWPRGRKRSSHSLLIIHFWVRFQRQRICRNLQLTDHHWQLCIKARPCWSQISWIKWRRQKKKKKKVTVNPWNNTFSYEDYNLLSVRVNERKKLFTCFLVQYLGVLKYSCCSVKTTAKTTVYMVYCAVPASVETFLLWC